MAITYLSGQRIQGVSNADRTITDDLTTDKGWVSNGTGNGWENSTNDAVDFKMVSPDASSGSDRDTVYIDVQDTDYLNGDNLSDTSFVAQCVLRFTTLGSASLNENRSYFGFFSSSEWGGIAQDRFILQVNTFPSASPSWRVGAGDNTLFESTTTWSSYFTDIPAIDTDYYVTFTKTGTAHKIDIREGSHSGSHISGSPQTSTLADVTALRYFGWKGRGDTQNNGGNVVGVVKPDIVITSGTTDEKTTVTDVPTGSQFEETDTRKFYQRAGSAISLTGLKAYFTMNETSGDIINRASEYGSTDAISNFDLSVTGATQGVSGKYNKCVSFSGNQSAVADDSSLSDTAFLSNNGAKWTICFWTKVEGLASGGNIEGDQAWFSTSQFGTGENGVMCRVAATVAPPNNPAYTALILGTNGDDKVSGTSSANGLEDLSSPTGWHFVVIQYDDSTGIARDMKDNSGTWNNIFTGANLTNTTTPSAKFRLAQWYDNSNNLNGDMESVSIWDRILDTDELTSLYTSTAVGQGLAPSWVERGTAI